MENYCQQHQEMRRKECKLERDEVNPLEEELTYFDYYSELNYKPQAMLKKQSSTFEEGMEVFLIKPSIGSLTELAKVGSKLNLETLTDAEDVVLL